MPPYGTPTHPYVTMYPPSLRLIIFNFLYLLPFFYCGIVIEKVLYMKGNTTGGNEGDATRQSEVKEKLPIKRSRGSLGSLNIITGKNSGASANGAYSKSGKSASDGSSEGSDANSQNGAPTSASTPVHGVVAPVSRDGGRSQPWLQVTIENVKRQRRKQSNRESARRSRLRKQAECDELAQRAEVLNEENASLREEINKLRSQCEELTSENTSLKDQLLSFPTLEGVAMDKDEQEPPDPNQTGVAETKADSYKDSK
ncbi:unnamed protein product [Brassica rapa subsp. trilocularis]